MFGIFDVFGHPLMLRLVVIFGLCSFIAVQLGNRKALNTFLGLALLGGYLAYGKYASHFWIETIMVAIVLSFSGSALRLIVFQGQLGLKSWGRSPRLQKFFLWIRHTLTSKDLKVGARLYLVWILIVEYFSLSGEMLKVGGKLGLMVVGFVATILSWF